jgi:hypothetical protein
VVAAVVVCRGDSASGDSGDIGDGGSGDRGDCGDSCTVVTVAHGKVCSNRRNAKDQNNLRHLLVFFLVSLSAMQA